MRLRTRGAIASLAVGIIALALGTAPARAADDPALDQTVAADEEASTESAVIDTGHVDIGPRMVDGQWSVALRDDSGAHPAPGPGDRLGVEQLDSVFHMGHDRSFRAQSLTCGLSSAVVSAAPSAP